MSIIASNSAPERVLKPELLLGYSPYMIHGMELHQVMLFIKRSNDSVTDDGVVRFAPTICKSFIRKMILWTNHYWYHDGINCDRCRFINRIMDISNEFIRNPKNAELIIERYFK